MANSSKRLLFWTPRILSILFIAFVSLFALDVFDGKHSFWQTMLAFAIHQIPVFMMIAILILAWRWEWIGAVLYSALGLLHIVWALFIQSHMPSQVILFSILIIDGPAFLIACLFLANWRKRQQARFE
jgi:hypothetical protein